MVFMITANSKTDNVIELKWRRREWDDNVYSSGQFDNNQYTARHETNNRNNGYQKHESQENSSHSTYSAYRQPTDQGSGLSSFLKVGATAVALGTAVVGLAKLFSSSHDDDR